MENAVENAVAKAGVGTKRAGPEARGPEARRMRGQRAYHSGLAAEERVSAHYARQGHELAGARWRGKAGEIDLVLRKGGEVVFVEVKQARSLQAASFRLSERQLGRVCAAAEEFLAGEPGGLATPARVDLALVGGTGEVEIVENVMAA